MQGEGCVQSESQIETEDPTNLLSCICMLYI